MTTEVFYTKTSSKQFKQRLEDMRCLVVVKLSRFMTRRATGLKEERRYFPPDNIDLRLNVEDQ